MNKNYKYNFSVIMCIYNVEKYLEEAIKSIIKQDIIFEKNIQLILVNDGSTDNSKEICMHYQKKYSNNIIYLEKENGGLASAKNAGLEYAEGKYISFFDSDDTLPINVFKEVFNFFRKNELCVDFVSIPLYFFGEKTGIHPKYNYMGKKNRIINLVIEPYNFVLSGAASFYKHEIFDSFKFNESYLGEEDTLLNGSIYLKNPRFGYVCERGVKYNYRKREEKNSIVDTSKINPQSYHTVIKLLNEIIPSKNLMDYQKEIIIYEVRSRLKQIEPTIFESKEEFEEIIEKMNYWIKKIDIRYILFYSKFCDNLETKLYFCSIVDKDFKNNKNISHYLLSNTNVKIMKVSFTKNKILLDVKYNNFGNKNIDLLIFDKKNKITNSETTSTYNSCYDLKIGQYVLDKTHIKKFELKLDNIKQIKFILYDRKENTYIPPKHVILENKVLLNSTLKKIIYKNKLIKYDGRKIIVEKIDNRKQNILKLKIGEIFEIYSKTKKFAILRLFCRRNKKYILINDRANKADDNGEALFKYIYANKEKNIKTNTYFVISKNCTDYKRLKKIGNVVALKSLKHKFLFLNSKIIYSSHTMPEFYYAFNNDKLYLYKDLLKYTFVWLQHGVTQNDISVAANSYRKGIDYVVTATKDETIEFRQDKYSYDENHVLLTGFSRYDFLSNDPKNIITIIPTWRRGIGNDAEIDDELFKQTNYYKSYCKLLTNSKLINNCEKNNIKINFVLHPEMEKYKKVFMKFKNKTINIFEPHEINYKDIFKNSKLLITDYSSVFFDFAYLKKPQIYFQFDKEDFYKNHYKAGYFSYDKHGFGDVVSDVDSLVNKVEYYINNNFKIEKKYINRIQNTFKYVDFNNSKRIIERTLENKSGE